MSGQYLRGDVLLAHQGAVGEECQQTEQSICMNMNITLSTLGILHVSQYELLGAPHNLGIFKMKRTIQLL